MTQKFSDAFVALKHSSFQCVSRFEMILAECGRSSAADQKEASAQMHNTIASLSPTEFTNLTELREAIVAETVQAGAAKPSPEVAAEYADRLITTLGAK